MERREVAESALKQLCEEIGVTYTTETAPVDGAWFLETVTRGRVNIMAWTTGDAGKVTGLTHPLGSSQTMNLTHEQAYDQCWFAHRCIEAANRAATAHLMEPYT